MTVVKNALPRITLGAPRTAPIGITPPALPPATLLATVRPEGGAAAHFRVLTQLFKLLWKSAGIIMTLPVATDEIEVRRPFFLKPLPFQVGSRRMARCHAGLAVAIYTDASQAFLLGTTVVSGS